MMDKKQAIYDLVNSFQGVIYMNYYATTGIYKLKVIFNNEAGEQEKYTTMSADEPTAYAVMYDKIQRNRNF